MSKLVAIAAYVCITGMKNIQLIEKQKGSYRLLINGVECLFVPLDLFTTGLMPVKRTQVNNSLGWYVNRKFVSYNKIKAVIKR
jgi:hypothetical protein